MVEYQANQAMAALLLPKALLIRAVEPWLSGGRFGGRVLLTKDVLAAAEAVADTFDVNPVVARNRVQTILPIG